ncbi:MAG: hypothetical protein D6769_01570 [Methanobacteriota archaeon]|nr:MAG: hypothetical protein D6769_01570 [Euryarchaeota archaeon]
MERKDLNAFAKGEALALAIYELADKIEDNNRLIKTLIRKVEMMEGKKEKEVEELLSEQDRAIVEYIKKEGKASAEDIRKELHYKGRNAASARLNNLCKQGTLYKRYVGKKVYFFLAR